MPPQNEIIEIAKEYFNTYGIWIVLISAFIEGTLLLGLYYPGSIVIVLGVILSNGDIKMVFLVVLVASLGIFTAYIVDYFLGKYGWYKLLVKFGLKDQIESAKNKLEKYELRVIFLSYWHPNFAAVISTAAGILKLSFRRFVIHSALILLAWNVLWGSIAYFFGEVALRIIGFRFVFVIAVFWIGYVLFFEKQQNKKNLTV